MLSNEIGASNARAKNVGAEINPSKGLEWQNT